MSRVTAAECKWCGAALVPEDGVWTDAATRSGDYCPEGLAVGRTGTSPHLPLLLADTPSVEVDDGDGGRWKGIDGEGRAIRPSVEPAAGARLRAAIEALPVHSWSGYEWEWDCSEDYHDGERCPHPEEHNDVITISRTRLLALLPTQASDSPDPDPDVESCVRWAMTHYDQPLDGDLSAKDVVGLSAFIARHLSERIEAEASDSPEKRDG